ncbi:hypothetical protein EST38_g1795 [Candolleomyces aberdarensis]|uniref:Uncharacterized protein n=1 Tax=Candolleomyces aberdarensis TaxID=2316362 RepID=A0A4Q2DUZ4_9AGAR|nr:hypothetical protein EST38_g1795 [Candolleomyces aberdarensis]
MNEHSLLKQETPNSILAAARNLPISHTEHEEGARARVLDNCRLIGWHDPRPAPGPTQCLPNPFASVEIQDIMTYAKSIAETVESHEDFGKYIDDIFSRIPSHQPLDERDDTLTKLNSFLDNAVDNCKLDVTKAMVGAFQGAAGQEIVDEIYGMAHTTNNLNMSFERAYRLLLKIDRNKYAREDGSIMEYAPTWRRYHETFRQLITESKNIASTGKCYAERYAQEVPEKLEKLRKIVEDPRTETESIEKTRKRAKKTMQLIEASINILLKDLDDTEKRATDLGAKLSELWSGVRILSEELEQDVDRLAPTVDYDVIIKTAEEGIKQVRAKLAKLKRQVSALFSVAAVSLTACGGIGWASGARCVSSIWPILGPQTQAPLSILATLLGEALNKEMRTAKENLEALRKKRDSLAQSKADVTTIKEEVSTIATQLGTVMKIWSSIQSDAVQLKVWLKGCLDPEIPVEDVVSDLSEMKIGFVYNILCQVLQTYSTEVNVSILKPLDT